jgi:hypothetical protein
MTGLILRPLIVVLVALTALIGIAVGVGRALRGTLLTYEANFPTDIELYAYDMEHRLSVNLTRNPNSYDTDAAWSPDGERMAFISWRGRARQLYLLTLSPPSIRRLSTHQVMGENPVWSPDGSLIAFYAGAASQLYVIEPDGSNMRLSGEASGMDGRPYSTSPLWSEDGTLIASLQPDAVPPTLIVSRRDGAEVRRYRSPGEIVGIDLWLPGGLLLTEIYQLRTPRIVQITPEGDQLVLLENASYPVRWR